MRIRIPVAAAVVTAAAVGVLTATLVDSGPRTSASQAPKAVALVASNNSTNPAKPSQDPSSDAQSALGTLADNLQVATDAGQLAGQVLGTAIGCPVGAMSNGLAAAPNYDATALPNVLNGCVQGANAASTVGTVLGGMAALIPAGIGTAVQQFSTVHAPDAH